MYCFKCGEVGYNVVGCKIYFKKKMKIELKEYVCYVCLFFIFRLYVCFFLCKIM